MLHTPPCSLAAISDIDPIVWLLPLVAAYATWRAVVYAKQKRWAIFIPVVFVIGMCLYEFGVQLYRNVLRSPTAPPPIRQIDGDPGGASFTAPPDDEAPSNAGGEDPQRSSQ